MPKYKKQIPHGTKVRFIDDAPIYKQNYFWVYENQCGPIVRLKSNPELSGTDFNAHVDELIVVKEK